MQTSFYFKEKILERYEECLKEIYETKRHTRLRRTKKQQEEGDKERIKSKKDRYREETQGGGIKVER